MTLQRLVSQCPPPREPVFTSAGLGWSEVERRLGLVLPQDYKECLDVYGAGTFGGFLSQLNPFLQAEGYSYFDHVDELLSAYRELRRQDAGEWPFPTHPEVGGLFPAAISDNGDTLYWITEGATDMWPLVLYNSRHWRYERYNMTLTSWIGDWLGGSLATDILPHIMSPVFVRYEP